MKPADNRDVIECDRSSSERTKKMTITGAFYRTCPECERSFDLLDEVDAEEYAYGHDCEVEA
jgi:hypothetical protein